MVFHCGKPSTCTPCKGEYHCLSPPFTIKSPLLGATGEPVRLLTDGLDRMMFGDRKNTLTFKTTPYLVKVQGYEIDSYLSAEAQDFAPLQPGYCKAGAAIHQLTPILKVF